MNLQSLPPELLEDILLHIFQASWAKSKSQFIMLRLIDRRSDEIVSRIALEALDPAIFMRENKSPASSTVRWLLFTKTCWTKGGRDALLGEIHQAVLTFLRPNAWKTDVVGNYQDYLRHACYLVGLQHADRFILSSLIYPTVMSEYTPSLEAGGQLDGSMQLAANHGEVSVVHELLSQGMSPNSNHFLFGYALNAAAHGGHVDIVALLCRYGADVNQKNQFGQSPTLVAAQMGRKDLVTFLLNLPQVQTNSASLDGHTPLLWAVKWGWNDVVQSLLSTSDVDLNQRPKLEDTPLSAAVRGGFDDIFNILMQRSDLQPAFRGGRFCPLWLALLKGDSHKVMRLLDRFSLNPNIILRHGNTLLCKAIDLGNTDLVRMMLERSEVDPNLVANSKRATPLHRALNHVEILKLLIARDDLDLNRISIGLRPLERAYNLGDEEIIQLLLSRKDTRSDLHEAEVSPLNNAAANGQLEVVRQLLLRPENDPNQQSKTRGPPLCEAAAKNQLSMVKELLQIEQVNPNLRWNMPGSQETALYLAIQYGSIAMVELLLLRDDIDINLPGPSGTALCAAISYGSVEICELLLHRDDVDVNVSGPEGTALTVAIRRSNRHMVEILLRRADLDINRLSTPHTENHIVLKRISSSGQSYPLTYGKALGTFYTQHTPLQQAVKIDDVKITKLLLSHPEIDYTTADGLKRTPLWWASYMGHKPLVKTILELGEENLNARDIDGWAPLLVAVNWRNSEVVELLLNQPTVDPNLANNDGWTPLHLAVRASNTEIVKMLLKNPAIDPRKQLEDGLTPIDLAKRQGLDSVANDLRTQLKKVLIREAAEIKNNSKTGVVEGDSQAVDTLKKLLILATGSDTRGPP